MTLPLSKEGRTGENKLYLKKEIYDVYSTLTDYEDQLEEVQEPAFKHKPTIKVQLQPKKIEEIKKIAKSKGIGYNVLIREWIPGKIHVS